MEKPILSIDTACANRKGLAKRVSLCHGWCEITPLGGEMEEGIFMATFADDARTLFEVNDDKLSVLLTQYQGEVWETQLDQEEQVAVLEEILEFYLRWKEDQS
jgi:hypothetical protein